MPKQTYLPAEQRKESTVRAVVELCAQDDPARVTTGAIAKRMKVSHAALFRHFPSKEKIWEAVIKWIAERVMQRIEAAAGSVEGSLARLEAMFMAHVNFIVEYPGAPRLVFGQLQQHEPTPARRLVAELLERYHQRIKAVLEAGQADGEIAADLDVDAAATQFIGMLQGLVVQSLLAGDVGRIRTAAGGVFAIYRRGIRTGSEAAT